MSWNYIWKSAAGSLALLAVSCIGLADNNPFSTDEDSPEKQMENLALVAAAANQTQRGTGSATKQIGPEGGSLADPTGQYELIIPPGALDAQEEITMRVKTANTNSVQGYGPATPMIQFSPSGLQFKQPATLKLKAPPSGLDLRDAMTNLYYVEPDTQSVLAMTTSREGEYIVGEIEHFSTYAGLYLRIDDVVADRITDPGEIQLIAAEFLAYLQGMSNQGEREYFYDLYKPTLLPFLRAVAGAFNPNPDPLMLAYPNDDFDLDGLQNDTDAYPADATNSGDTMPPAIVSVNPTGNNIPLAPGLIEIEFDEPISAATANYAAYLSDGNAQYLLTFVSMDPGNRIATYRYDYTLSSDQNYSIHVRGVKDAANNVMVDTLAGSFGTVDQTPPRILSVSPTGEGIPRNNVVVTIEFNESMDLATLNGFSLLGPGSPTLALSSLSPDSKTATFDVSINQLQDSQYFILSIPAGVKDVAGNPLAQGPGIFYFRTIDASAPKVLAASPNGQWVNPDNPPNIVLDFSEPVDPSTVPGRLSLEGPGSPQIAFVQMQRWDTRAIFEIIDPLQQETAYTIRVKQGIRDLNGFAQNRDTLFEFRSGDTIPPTVESLDPTGNGVAFDQDVTIRAVFSDDLPASLFMLNNALIINSGAISYSLTSYDPATRTAVFSVPAAQIEQATRYTIQINPALTDDGGNAFTGQTTFEFWSASVNDPQLVDYYIYQCPAQNKTGVRLEYDRPGMELMTSPFEPSEGHIKIRHRYLEPGSGRYNCSYIATRQVKNPALDLCLTGAFGCGAAYAICAQICYNEHPVTIPEDYWVYQTCDQNVVAFKEENIILTPRHTEQDGRIHVYEGNGLLTPSMATDLSGDYDGNYLELFEVRHLIWLTNQSKYLSEQTFTGLWIIADDQNDRRIRFQWLGIKEAPNPVVNQCY